MHGSNYVSKCMLIEVICLLHHLASCWTVLMLPAYIPTGSCSRNSQTGAWVFLYKMKYCLPSTSISGPFSCCSFRVLRALLDIESAQSDWCNAMKLSACFSFFFLHCLIPSDFFNFAHFNNECPSFVPREGFAYIHLPVSSVVATQSVSISCYNIIKVFSVNALHQSQFFPVYYTLVYGN